MLFFGKCYLAKLFSLFYFPRMKSLLFSRAMPMRTMLWDKAADKELSKSTLTGLRLRALFKMCQVVCFFTSRAFLCFMLLFEIKSDGSHRFVGLIDLSLTCELIGHGPIEQSVGVNSNLFLMGSCAWHLLVGFKFLLMEFSAERIVVCLFALSISFKPFWPLAFQV